MRKILVCAAVAVSAISAGAQVKPATAKPKTIVTAKPAVKPAGTASIFKNSTDSFSYAAGMSVAESMQQTGITNLNSALVLKGMNAVLTKSKPALTKEEANMCLQSTMQRLADKRSSASKEEGRAFLELNKKRTGITALPNGLQYEVIKAGDPSGMKPKAIDTVVVNYVGTLTNGTEFDNSIKRGQAASFPLNGVIRGWTEILQLMTKGAHWKVYIPGDLAYGENPPPGSSITPNAVLIFEITLEDIKPAQAAPAQ